MASRRSAAIDVVKGAVAGTAATWVMGRATTWLYEREDPQAKERENRARGGGSAYENAADRGARLLGVNLATAQRARAGTAIHWATGIAAGALYEVLRRRWAPAAAAKGLAFGGAFFLAVDELMNPLLGFTPGPRAFPWQAHARGLAGHLAFGATADAVLEGLDRVA